MNNDIRLDLNKTQQYKNIRLEYLTPSTEIYIYKSYRFRKSGAPPFSQFWFSIQKVYFLLPYPEILQNNRSSWFILYSLFPLWNLAQDLQ